MLNYILIPTMFTEGWYTLRLGSLTLLMDGLEELGLIDWTWCCFIWLLVFEGPRHSSGHWETTTLVIKLTIVSVLTRPVDIWISLITQQLTSHLLFYASPYSRLRNDQLWDVTIMVVTSWHICGLAYIPHCLELLCLRIPENFYQPFQDHLQLQILWSTAPWSLDP